MGTLRFFEEVVSFKIRRTFGFADYICTIENAGIPLFCQKAPGKRGSKLLPGRVL